MLRKSRLLTPGPTALPERVRLAMAHDMIHHRKPEFQQIMLNTQVGLKELFDVDDAVLPLACSGSGAMVASVAGVFKPGDRVLVVNAGKFAERWLAVAKHYGLDVVEMEIPWGKAACPKQIEEALSKDPSICGVLVQLSETSLGVQHPIKEIAAVTRKTDALLLVDGISGVSITPCPMNEWGVDCLITGSQKGLMLPPGLALLAYSQRAWKKAEQIPARAFYFNLVKERDNCRNGQTSYTPAVSLIVGLEESLKMFKEVGFKQVFRKQWALTQMVRKGISELGFELFAKEHYSWGLTSLLLPENIDTQKFLSIAAEKYGTIFAAGKDAMGKSAGERTPKSIIEDSMVRVGHMGWVDYGDMLTAIHALHGSFVACGGVCNATNYMENAVAAYWEAFDAGYPE